MWMLATEEKDRKYSNKWEYGDMYLTCYLDKLEIKFKWSHTFYGMTKKGKYPKDLIVRRWVEKG